MKRNFTLHIQPFSINQQYTRTHFLSSKYKDWIENVLGELSTEKIRICMEELRNFFNPEIHYYAISIINYYPKRQFFNAKKTVSAKTMDVSNTEKSILDVLCLPKYAEWITNLNIDDKNVWELHSKKMFTEEFNQRMEIEIEIKEF